jgi:hypothetical protein
MNVWRLAAREIGYRRLNFGLGALAVLVAVGCLVAELTLLRAHDVRAENIADSKEALTRDMVGRLQDDYRKMMKDLGYNLLILSKDQDLGEFYSLGHATRTMPEEYVARVANSKILTVQHLLPSLQQKLEWPEKKVPIILMGTRGEVPLAHRDPMKPILAAVPPGEMIVGRVVADRVGLKKGDKTTLLGKEFLVRQAHPERGNEDDVTVWIDLEQAQEILGKPGEIHAILALSCFCAESNIEAIRKEIGEILDHKAQVIELSREAAIRRAARGRAEAHGDEALTAETAGRDQLRRERHAVAEWIVPLVVVGCIVWVGLLALGNARDRRGEIGILRAIGVRSIQVLTIFLARAVLMGLIGAVAGYVLGFAVAAVWDARESGGQEAVGVAALFGPGLLAAALVAAPLLSAVASLVPAMMAARQDPAVVLREE